MGKWLNFKIIIDLTFDFMYNVKDTVIGRWEKIVEAFFIRKLIFYRVSSIVVLVSVSVLYEIIIVINKE